MTITTCSISFKNVSLVYDLYYDRTNTLKEYIVGLLHRRQYVDVKKGEHYALKNINLTIEHGERLGIIGLNGSGKSTLLKAIAGLLKPTKGDLEIHGTVQPLIEIGAGFNPEFSGRENIYLNGAMLGFSKKQIKVKENEIIEFTELGNFIDVPVKYYSSGMMLRLAFTIATIIRPEILLLDEMLSAGDMEFLQKAKERMDQVLSSAKILVIVSHDMGMIRSLASRVIVLNKGEIFYDGDAEDAIDFYTTMVSSNIEKKHEILRLRDEERKKQDELIRQQEMEKQKDEHAIQERLRIEEEERRRQEEVKNRIIIHSSMLKNCSRDGEGIFPDDTVSFSVEFQTNNDFDRFFINLVLKNKTNTDIAHLRNDFSGIELPNFKKGFYKVRIPIYRLPFRSDSYRYYFRLVGFKDQEQTITDSSINVFSIQGNVKRDNIIKHEWEIEMVAK